MVHSPQLRTTARCRCEVLVEGQERGEEGKKFNEAKKARNSIAADSGSVSAIQHVLASVRQYRTQRQDLDSIAVSTLNVQLRLGSYGPRAVVAQGVVCLIGGF